MLSMESPECEQDLLAIEYDYDEADDSSVLAENRLAMADSSSSLLTLKGLDQLKPDDNN